MPAKVLLVGDTHGMESCAIAATQRANEEEVDYIVQLGDFAYNFKDSFIYRWSEAEAPVWFLRGNHDNTHAIRDLTGGPLHATWEDVGPRHISGTNVSYLPDGLFFQLGDSRVVAMGGAASIDRNRRARDYSWWEEEHVNLTAAMDLLYHGSRPDVMLCHDVPGTPHEIELLIAGFGYHSGSALSRDVLRFLFNRLRPHAVYHGHYHHPYEEEFLGAKFVGLDADGPEALMVVEF